MSYQQMMIALSYLAARCAFLEAQLAQSQQRAEAPKDQEQAISGEPSL